jgi:hypothetical protein
MTGWTVVLIGYLVTVVVWLAYLWWSGRQVDR